MGIPSLSVVLSMSLGITTALPAAGRADPLAALGDVFLENAGQVDARVAFYGLGAAASVYVTPAELRLQFSERAQPEVLALKFVGASPGARIEGRRPTGAHVAFFRGADAARRSGRAAAYGEVVIDELWPGIDLVLRRVAGRLKYELIVAPGASPATIQLALEGVSALRLDAAGNLVGRTARGTIRDERPLSWQEVDGQRVPIASRFVVGRGGRHGFKVGAYDRSRPLVIDPGLTYSSWLGWGSDDVATDQQVDAAGKVYVTGAALLPYYATTAVSAPGDCDDCQPFAGVFVAKVDPTASGPAALVWAAFVGGSAPSVPGGMGVDVSGVSVGGLTYASDLPTTDNAFQPVPGDEGAGNAFVFKLDPTGTTLLYSSYFGGLADDAALGATLAGGHLYLSGNTAPVCFPTTAYHSLTETQLFESLAYTSRPGFEDTPCGLDGTPPVIVGPPFEGWSVPRDAFVAKFDLAADGADSLVYSVRYALLGSIDVSARNLAVDGAGRVAITGSLGEICGTLDDFCGGQSDESDGESGGFEQAYVALFDADGTTLEYQRFFGGSMRDRGTDVAFSGELVVASGVTNSDDFPMTGNAFAPTHGGGYDDFLVVLEPAAEDATVLAIGAADDFVYATYLGGEGDEADRAGPVGGVGNKLRVDGAGRAYLTGATGSWNFPTTCGAYDRTFGAIQTAGASAMAVSKIDVSDDAFLSIIDPSKAGTASLVYSGFLGGQGDDGGGAIALGGPFIVYVAGATNSGDFPTSAPSSISPAPSERADESGEDDYQAFVTGIDIRTPAPAIVCGQNTDPGLAVGAECTATLPHSASASDLCAPPPPTVSCTRALDVVGPGNYTSTCTATNVSGNAASCTSSFLVRDVAPPTITCPAAPTQVECSGACATSVTFGAPTVLDNCGATGQCAPASQSGFCLGDTTVTCTAQDAANNTSECNFNVKVVDTIAPQISCSASASLTTKEDLAGACSATLQVGASATDACTATPTVTCETSLLTLAGPGATSARCTAVDSKDHSASCDVALTLSDNSPPLLSCPADREVPANSIYGTATETVLATASDTCDGPLTVSCDPAGGVAVLPSPGTATVVCSAVDAGLNAASCQTKVTSKDVTAPATTCEDLVLAPESDCRAEVVASGSAKDNVSGVVPLVCELTGERLPLGSYTSTCRAVDEVGNEGVCTRTITIEGETRIVTDPVELWPPNHVYVPFSLASCAVLYDACDNPLDVTEVAHILRVTSDEPEDATGLGDGHTCDDMVLVDDTTLLLRSERAGGRDGRVYEVTFEVEIDGVMKNGACVVSVPHDQSGVPAGAGEPRYCVGLACGDVPEGDAFCRD